MLKSKDIYTTEMKTYIVFLNGHEVGSVSAASTHDAELKAAQTYHASILNIHVSLFGKKYKL